jgi:integrase
MSKGNLTDVQLRKWIKARALIAGKSDGGGLTFTLSKAGTAAWVLRYRVGNKPRELTLGRYPDLSLADARDCAATERARIIKGADPASDKRIARITRATARTYRDLAEDYMVRAAPSLSERTRKEIRRYLDKDILPRVGGLPISGISPAEIVHLVETVAARSKNVARRTFEIISTIFAHGVAKHLAGTNPCTTLRISAIVGAKMPRERLKLHTEELRTLLSKLPQFTAENALCVRILLTTAVRKSELIGARWEEIDLDNAVWRLPAARNKSGRDFTIPLPGQTVAHFRALRQHSGESEWVLPQRWTRPGRKGSHINVSTLNAALDRLDLDMRHFTPHDLRSTARSYLTDELGVSVLVAERALNHALGGLIGVYDKSDYMPERRRALEMWASHLDDIEAGRCSRVTALRVGAA